jgi:hypothetical protein
MNAPAGDERDAEELEEEPAYSSVELMAPPTETDVRVDGWPENDFCKVTIEAAPGEGRLLGSLMLPEGEARRVGRALLEEADRMAEGDHE